MKSFLVATSVAAAILTSPAFAADVGVSVSIGQPGFYGQIDIGNYSSRPQVIYGQPRIIERTVEMSEPIYLRVPPGHRKNWSKHCGQYNACGEQVYFVQDSWYQQKYVPQYQQQQRDRQDGRSKDRRGNEHGNKRNDRGGKNHGQGN